MAGDFNMAFTEVIKQLRSRGIKLECCAWYPWRHIPDPDFKTNHPIAFQQPLGFDSLGIFVISAAVQVSMPWELKDLDTLTARDLSTSELHVYHGQIHPGQHWSAYRSKALNEEDHDKDLKARLQDLLAPPQTAVAELQRIPPREGYFF